jgi:hypothetical protein
MRFSKHYSLAASGGHAFLSASKYAWINYDEDKLDQVFAASLAAAKGDRLHALAHMLIREGVKLPRTQQTLNMYVNDAIGFRMTPEQILYFSDNAYGTADAVSFRKNKLRIHDLKTGVTPASFNQLLVYCAYFFLEYGRGLGITPFDVEMELRIYQNDDIQVMFAEPGDVVHIMEKAKIFDKRITAMRLEANGY